MTATSTTPPIGAALRTLAVHRARVQQIVGVLGRYGFAHWSASPAYRHLSDAVPWIKDVAGGAGPWASSSDGTRGRRPSGSAMSDGERLRRALTELGPTFIKLGQVLSTRIDLVGPDIAAELAALQTDAPADDAATVRAIVARDLGRPVEEAFARFDDEPIASASIAQAHAAALHDGTEVVVKVQHAGIRQLVEQDFAILDALARVVEQHDADLALWRPRATLAQLARTVTAELDLVREAVTLARAGANFAAEDDVVIPTPYPELSGPHVLTMSRVDGRTLAEIAQDPAIDRRALALRAARIYLDMIFRDRLFHADPHPGNVIVAEGERGPVFCIIDWGAVGTVDTGLQDKLEGFTVAAATEDVDGVVDGILEIVTAPAKLDLDALRLDVSDWLEAYGSGDVQAVDVAAAIEDLSRIVREHRLRLPANVALLGKTLLQLQGDLIVVGADLRLPEALDGYLQELVRQRMSPKRLARHARRTAKDWDRFIAQAPRELTAILESVRMGELDVPLRIESLDRTVNRLVHGILAAALFSGSTQMWARGTPPQTRGRVSIPGAVGTIASAAIAIRVLRASRRSGGLF
jgi:ubiquinone biosynthesis protein